MADIIELIYEDHVWFRRYFLYLDQATTKEEQAAIWEPLASRLDAHAQAEEEIFYPAFLKQGDEAPDSDPEEETDDAIGDHNKIRDAVRATRSLEVGTDEWLDAVMEARKENGEHLEEEEREGMTHFLQSSTVAQRHEMAMEWLKFYARHWGGAGVDDSDRDVEEYIEENS